MINNFVEHTYSVGFDDLVVHEFLFWAKAQIICKFP